MKKGSKSLTPLERLLIELKKTGDQPLTKDDWDKAWSLFLDSIKTGQFLKST